MYKTTDVKLQAHRGVSTDAPENTLASYKLAIEQGYDIIELDNKFTLDGKIVCLHDWTLNRTATLSGKSLDNTVNIKDLNYEEALNYDVGESFSITFKGEKIPLFTDALKLIATSGLEVKIDNVVNHFPIEMRKEVYRIANESSAKIGFTCANIDYLKEVLTNCPNCAIHYDGAVDNEDVLLEVASLCEGRKLTFWIPFDNDITSWCQHKKANKSFVQQVKSYGEVGVWILSNDDEMLQAVEFGVDVVETTGGIKP